MNWRFRGQASRLWFTVVLILWAGTAHIYAQTESVTVPDLANLNVPQAAAALNRVGLRLGAQTAVGWTAASGQEPGAIAGQSVAPGAAVARGTTIDVTILSAANVSLIYDDNDLTLINNTGTRLDLTRLLFSGTEGTKRFLASLWRSAIDAGDCTQVWSLRRSGAKNVAGCDSIYWLTTNNTSEHFWTQTAGAGRFEVIWDGVPLATCDPAPSNSQDTPLVCEFFIATGAAAGAATAYVYFAYTTDHFAVINTSRDAWMPLDGTPLQIPGLELRMGDPALFGSPDIVADVRRLAPGQCSLLSLAPLSSASPPEDCDVIAQHTLSQTQAFWSVPFDILPITRPGERLTCPAAAAGRVTICIMPR